MALVHPELFLNIDHKVTALAFVDKKPDSPIKILVGTSEGELNKVNATKTYINVLFFPFFRMCSMLGFKVAKT